MTYSAGLMLGGSNIKVEPSGDASVSGKTNIVPGEALAIGDLRVLTPGQLARVKDKMLSIETFIRRCRKFASADPRTLGHAHSRRPITHFYDST